MARMPSNKFSWAFDDETSYGVLPGAPAWNAMEATRPEFTKGRDIEELNLSVSSDFSIQPRVTGSRHGGSFNFSVPIRSQLPGYALAGPLVANPEIELLTDLWGAADTGASAVADIAALTTANSWVLVAGAPNEGTCQYTATTTTSTVTSLGWCTDLAALTNTLFEDGVAIPAVTDDVLGMLTLYGDGSQPVSKSFLFRGQLQEHGLYLLGCVPTAATIRLANGKVPTVDFTYTFDGWEYDNALAAAGLLTETQYNRLPPIMGVNGGRITIDGGSTGVADPTGTCGLDEVIIEITADAYDVPCMGAPQGYSGIDLLGRNMKVSFSKPWEGSDIVADQSVWDTSLEDGTPFSLMVQTGNTVGSMMSFFIPEAVIVEQPQLADKENAMVWSLVASPSSGYSGDTGTTAPANTSARFAIG